MNIITDLDNRQLRFDGISIVNCEMMKSLLLGGVNISKIRLNERNHEIDQFLALHPTINLYDYPNSELNFEWNIPEEYKNLNFDEYVFSKFEEKTKTRNEEYIDRAINRTSDELFLFKKNDLVNLSKTIIFVLDTFRKNKIIWGVGRGSSSASYIFYLLGLHSVDCIKYGIDITEFIK